MTDFPPLPPALEDPRTETAQRFLGAAFDSVDAMLEWFDSAAELAADDAITDERLGTWTRDAAGNMLRASLVFAGAGLDSAIKQLVRDALPSVLNMSESADSMLLKFVERTVDPGRPGATRSLARFLTSENPRDEIVASYIKHLTGASLQSVEQVKEVARALGIHAPKVMKRMDSLRSAFDARNQVVHELDLVAPNAHGDRERRIRTFAEVAALAHAILTVGQELINATVEVLMEPVDAIPVPDKD